MNKNVIVKKLEEVLNMNNEFIKVIGEQDLKLRITGARSNTIGSQIACVARARDAYSKCILNNEKFSWNPDFSYNDRYDHSKLGNHLIEKGTRLIKELESCGNISENQFNLIIDLLSHEFMHQGQLIRYVYANNLTMPSLIKYFWHLED